eukprot:3392570-Ditylum_brightwellii.AAC.1
MNNNDQDYYLHPANAQEHAETNNLMFNYLVAIIPSAKCNNTHKKNALTELKKKDRKFVFDETKIRATAECSCSAIQAIYSNNKVGMKNGLTEAQLQDLE